MIPRQERKTRFDHFLRITRNILESKSQRVHKPNSTGFICVTACLDEDVSQTEEKVVVEAGVKFEDETDDSGDSCGLYSIVEILVKFST
jgi:hypothetical protein